MERRMGNKLLWALWILTTPLLIPVVVHAVTYTFPEREPAYLKDEAVINVGTKLYLFQSGTEDVKKNVNVNDVLIVSRELPSGFSSDGRATGKVRVLSTAGEYFYEAEVIEGAVQPGYLARKGTIACFITSFRKMAHQHSSFINR